MQRAINWVSSTDPLDTVLDLWDDGVERRSAGILKCVHGQHTLLDSS